MKYLKIYTLLLAAILVSACSDDDEVVFNTNEATVNMQETEMTVKENAGLCLVPVVVTGERNGAIQVTISVSQSGNSPATEDENYIVTTKTLLIPIGTDVANFEFRTVDDEDVNADRTFDITITDVKHASIGTNNKLSVTIKDNDADYYEKLAGTWIFTAKANGITVMGQEVAFSVKVNTAAGDAYGTYLVCSNQNGFDPEPEPFKWTFNWRLKYEYDAANQKIYVSIVIEEGEKVATDPAYDNYFIQFKRMALDGTTSDVYRGEYDDATKTITFEGNANLVGNMYHNETPNGTKFRLSNCKMARIK